MLLDHLDVVEAPPVRDGVDQYEAVGPEHGVCRGHVAIVLVFGE